MIVLMWYHKNIPLFHLFCIFKSLTEKVLAKNIVKQSRLSFTKKSLKAVKIFENHLNSWAVLIKLLERHCKCDNMFKFALENRFEQKTILNFLLFSSSRFGVEKLQRLIFVLITKP